MVWATTNIDTKNADGKTTTDISAASCRYCYRIKSIYTGLQHKDWYLIIGI
jgi:hypothetical protein